MALMVRKLHATARDAGDPLEESMATFSSILAWRIPWTEESDGPSVPRVTKSGT